MGESPRTKRDSSTGEFIDQKKAPAKKKFKGVRREKGRLIWRRGLQGSTDSLAQAKEEEGLRRLGYQNIRSRYQTRYRVDANTQYQSKATRAYKSRTKARAVAQPHPIGPSSLAGALRPDVVRQHMQRPRPPQRQATPR